MNYRIKRGDQEFGPYSLAELQHYVQTGHISTEDLALSEGMSDWTPVSQILGDIPAPNPLSPVSVTAEFVQPLVPLPPNLHWSVLLVRYLAELPLAIFKIFSLVSVIWIFIQANWARKLSGKNTALVLVAMDVTGLVSGSFLAGISVIVHMRGLAGIGTLLIFAGAICGIAAAFTIRDAMEEYYTTVENIGLGLSGAMTFFFGVVYIQYHINRIARWKKTGELS